MNQAFRVALVLAVLAGIFLAGGLVGGVVAVHFARERMERFEQARQEERRQRQGEQQKLVQMVDDLKKEQLVQLQQLQQLRQQQSRPPGRGAALPERLGPQLMRRFINQVKATADEREKIRPMVNQAAEDLRRLQRETAHSTELILEHLEDQISAVLTPAQRDHFNDMIQRWREAFQKYNRDQQERQAQARLQEQQRRQQEAAPPGPLLAAPATPPAAK